MEYKIKNRDYVSPEIKVTLVTLSQNFFSGSGAADTELEPLEGEFW